MATAEQMFGQNARFYRGNGEIGLMIKDEVWQDPSLGGLDKSDLGPTGGDNEPLVTDDQLTAALLRILFVRANPQTFQDNPENRVVATSVSPGRQQIDFDSDDIFDTFDFTFQVRQLSESGNLPEPDNL